MKQLTALLSKNTLLGFTLGLALASPAQAALELKETGSGRNFLYEHDPKALATSMQFVIRTGSLADPKGKEGLASLSFQSLLRGTQAKDRKDFNASVERLGASLSVDTGSNRTILLLDSISDNFTPAVGLLAEAVLKPALKESEIDSLRQEALDGIHQELAGNRNVLKRVLRQALFHGTSLAFPPAGTSAGLQAVTPEDIRTFLAAQIKSGSIVVGVVSNLSRDQVKQALEASFSALADGEAPALPAVNATALSGRRLLLVERPGSSTTEVAIGHHGIQAGNGDREMLEVGQFLLGGDMSSRLFQELRAKKGWTYGAYSGFQFLEQPRRHGGSFQIYTFPQAEHTKEATAAALGIYEEFAKKGVTPTELRFARDSLGNSYPFKFATSRARLTARLYQFLDGAPLLTVPAYQRLVRGLTNARLTQAIKKAHDPANLVVVMVGDPAQFKGMQEALPGVKSVTVVTDPQAALP